MKTVWDLTDVNTAHIDLQRSGGPISTSGPIKTLGGAVTKVAVMVSVLFVSPSVRTTVFPAAVSSPIIAVRASQRATPSASRSARNQTGTIGEFAADARHGLSPRRLADTFSSLFTPTDEESVDVDYTFG